MYVDEVFTHDFKRDGGIEHRLDITYSSLPSTIEAWAERVGFRAAALGLDAEWKPVHVKGVKIVLALLQLSSETSALVIQLNALPGGPRSLGELCPKLATLLSGYHHAHLAGETSDGVSRDLTHRICDAELASAVSAGSAVGDVADGVATGRADGTSAVADGESSVGAAGGAGSGAAAMPPARSCVLPLTDSAALVDASKRQRLRVCGVGITADYTKTLSDCGIVAWREPPILVNLATMKKGGPKGLAAIAMAARAVDVTWKKKSLQMCNWEDWPLSRPKIVYAAMDAYAGVAAFVRMRPSVATAGVATLARALLRIRGAAVLTSAPARDEQSAACTPHSPDERADADASDGDAGCHEDESDHYLESGAESDSSVRAHRRILGDGHGHPPSIGGPDGLGLTPISDAHVKSVASAIAYFSLDKCGY